MVTPAFDRQERARYAARVVLQAAKNQAFERVEAPPLILELGEPGAVGGGLDVVDDGKAKLGAVDYGKIHQSEQVTKGIGSALAVASSVFDKFSLRAHGVRQRLERRLKFAQVGSAESILARGW